MEFIGQAIFTLLLVALVLFSLTPFIVGIMDGIESWREKREMRRRGYVRRRMEWPGKFGQQFGYKYTYEPVDGWPEDDDGADDARRRPKPHRGTIEDRTGDRYGEAHKKLRAAWKDIIRLHGAECLEHDCLMPSRRIEAGAAWDTWDLAHDHSTGGRYDYLGPAHKLCNQAEALRRGVTWDGAPRLEDLLAESARLREAARDPGRLGQEVPWWHEVPEDEPPDLDEPPY
ncbi:hypothetical protein [Nocardioides taihuensis]|uniref:HNH endonuclease n=1 Tax=Nocardioides taihuensis TaxID=1835606 RepID=A0ABW0BS31_9ACTN